MYIARGLPERARCSLQHHIRTVMGALMSSVHNMISDIRRYDLDSFKLENRKGNIRSGLLHKLQAYTGNDYAKLHTS